MEGGPVGRAVDTRAPVYRAGRDYRGVSVAADHIMAGVSATRELYHAEASKVGGGVGHAPAKAPMAGDTSEGVTDKRPLRTIG